MLRRLWRLGLAAVSALILLYLAAVAYQGISLGIAVKNYSAHINSAGAQQLNTEALGISHKTGSLLNSLNFPIVKQIAGVFGLDFTDVSPEIQAAIATSPITLGANKVQTYLISFQNSAEARGTGGILGAYAIVRLNKGKLSVEKTGSNAKLISLRKNPIAISDEYMRLYGNNPAIWQNSNLSPHFPYGAMMYSALWKNMTGQSLDGVIAVDPSALSYILKSTGDIKLANGEMVNSNNLVSKTLSTAYKKYETNNDARKQYLVDIMNATFDKLLAGKFSKVKFAQGIVRGIKENRILFYTTNKSSEQAIAQTRLGGALTDLPNNEFRVVIQNIDASKLDYYLARSVHLSSLSCGKARKTEVRVAVTNTVTATIAKNLPDYVLTRADNGKPSNLKPGQHRFKVFIYGPNRAQIISASRSNTKGAPAGASHELGRPIVITDVDLRPGHSEDLVANFMGGVGKITFHDQPLVIPTKVSISDNCQ
jgi:cytochrome b